MSGNSPSITITSGPNWLLKSLMSISLLFVSVISGVGPLGFTGAVGTTSSPRGLSGSRSFQYWLKS